MSDSSTAEDSQVGSSPTRWRALMMLALVQFIIYADATIVNVALPSIQRDLEIGSSTLVWVVNCYLLAAGGLLLLGGRLGDRFGHRRVFLAGTGGFAVASLIAGFAPGGGSLLLGRALQGISEGLAAPAGLALVALMFPDPAERRKAFGIWSGLAGLGAAAGLLLSGVLTEFLTWRLIFLLNIPVVAVAVVAVPRLVPRDRESFRSRLDWTGAVMITGCLFALLYGVLGVSANGWASLRVLIPVALGVVAALFFVIVEMRVSDPLIPVKFVKNRVRATAYLVAIVLGGATAALFFMIVLYMQNILGFAALASGLAWLPYTAAFMAGIMASIRVVSRWGPQRTMIAGLIVTGTGMFLLSLIRVDGSFLVDLLLATMLLGFGIGFANPGVQFAAMTDVSERDAGLGSGLFTTLLQLSGAVGLSVLTSIALTASRAAASGTTTVSAEVDGYRAAFLVATIALGLAALAVFVLIPRAQTLAAGPDSTDDSVVSGRP